MACIWRQCLPILAISFGIAGVTAGLSIARAGDVFPTLSGKAPIVIAHRGASGYLPEHTLAAYELAIDLGADFIEPDLVITKDGHLVARHDRYLSTTTDVAERPEFADRRRIGEGHDGADWFVEDFTLAEIKSLRARQGFPGRDASTDGRLEIPTFAEVIELVRRKSGELGREIGLYPETKSPGYHARIGLDFVPPLLAALRDAGYRDRDDKVFIQSFEPEILKRLRPKTKLRLVMLLFPRRELDPDAGPTVPNVGLDEVAGFVDGIGPSKRLLVGPDGKPTGLVAAAHALGLEVHPWTFRDDRLPDGIAAPYDEYALFFELGVDGLFSDFPDTARSARVVYRARRELVKEAKRR